MYRIALLCVFSAALAACSPPPTAPESREGTDGADPLPTSPIVKADSKRFGIGDVETGLRVTLRLDAESKLGNVKYEELETMRKDLARVSVEVRPPYPDELWLTFLIRANIGFQGNPVRVKARVYVDKNEVEAFEFVFGENPALRPRATRVNVLAGLDTVPESLLVHAEVEAALFEGVDPASFDPATAVARRGNTVTVFSNPVRIDFGT